MENSRFKNVKQGVLLLFDIHVSRLVMLLYADASTYK
jgi:hypothetical protein